MRKSKAERIKDVLRKAGDPVRIGVDGEDPSLGLAKFMAGGALNPTQALFFHDAERYTAYKGPAGCGKSVIGLIAGLSRALWIPGSVGVVAQHDYNHLLSSTYQTFQRIIGRLPEGTILDRDKSPPMKIQINPIGGGEPSTIIFMGLKENLGGYEFNWAFLDEADKIDEMAVRLVDGRLRYPGGGYKLMMAFNPPDKHHWLYTACTGRDYQERRVKTPWLKLYEPAPDENSKNLPADYYANLRKSYTSDMVQRLVDGEWGSTFEGSPVYREFNKKFHVQQDLLGKFSPYKPLFRFWDFGYSHPYCCWAQMDWEGRLLVMYEKLGENIEATAFARLCKTITTENFPGAKEIVDFGDPAVAQQKDTGRTLSEFAKEGILIRYRNSHIEEGVQCIRQNLEKMNGGEALIQFDQKYVPILIGALSGGYHLDKKGLKPVKDGFYDHAADAFRYGMIHVFNNSRANLHLIPRSIEYDPTKDVL